MTNLINNEICERCRNYGYYKITINKQKQVMQMFCRCPIGQALKRLSIEWRLKDIEVIADNILPRLNILKHKDKEQAIPVINALIEDIEKLVNGANKALKD